MPASASQSRTVQQVEVVATNDCDTDTLVSGNSKRTVAMSQHGSENEGVEFRGNWLQ